MKNISISLLVSTYNWHEALEVCLLSIAKQTVLPDEVVIADDGSGEETQDLIEKMKKEMPYKLIHVWQENKGFRAGQIRNKGIAATTCDYIIQIDGDMIPERHFVEDHINMADKSCFAVGSRVNTTEDLTRHIIENKELPSSPFSKGIVNRLNTMRCSSLMSYYKFRYKKNNPYYARGCNMAYWRKDVIAVNGYNEDMTGWGREDSELAVRLFNLGCKKQFIKFGAVAFHLYHEENSRERESININIWEDTIKNKVEYTPNGLDKYL